ncbi:c-type cytochrome [Rhodospirillum centenum]|uniref:Cytochrome C6, putative n=1 Tax=Rhodospirillum centenum (strain ATCC 51521 / SW) TaxID=414684 RepID=B6IY90_RHOCS|nr:cytochrome c [Rhodospirillum centenum]ACJ01264.1 cytochrome C6, putative [Rhodospirillum centenum SW]
MKAMMNPTRKRTLSGLLGTAAVLAAVTAVLPAAAQSTDVQSSAFAAPDRFAYSDGGELYRAICQGCHMPTGEGASGAGAYPALAANPNLEVAAYPVSMVVGGRKAMPSFSFLSDAQISAVVGYVRTHFGNQFPDPVPVEEVAAARQAAHN